MDKIPSLSFILDRVRQGGVEWKEGKFFLLGMNAWISAAFSCVFLQRLLEEKVDLQQIQQLYYAHGQFQAREGVRIFNKRFGYPKTFSERAALLDLHLGQFTVTGTGQYQWVLKDMQNKEFIVSGISPLAEEYGKYFSTDRRPIDHFIRGLMAGFISETIGEELYCFESTCIAHGKPQCTFIIKEKKKYDPSAPGWKEQEVEENLNLLRELYPHKEPLL